MFVLGWLKFSELFEFILPPPALQNEAAASLAIGKQILDLGYQICQSENSVKIRMRLL